MNYSFSLDMSLNGTMVTFKIYFNLLFIEVEFQFIVVPLFGFDLVIIKGYIFSLLPSRFTKT